MFLFSVRFQHLQMKTFCIKFKAITFIFIAFTFAVTDIAIVIIVITTTIVIIVVIIITKLD